jgi:isopentenyldiphosphate isomerase
MPVDEDPEELLDLVDDQDKVIGTVTRGEVDSQLLDLPGSVRAADCFMVNSQGQIWVPRRTAHKQVAPNGLDFSAGEHVQAGESYQQAMIRGFKEELNMEIELAKLQHVDTINLHARGIIPYYDAVFVYQNDAVPDYNRTDFVSYEWLTPEELKQKLEAGEPAKRNLLPALELFIQAKK